MAAQGLRDRKLRQVQARIQECAVDLFESQGFADTTIDQIAAAADVGARTVHRRFESKEALLFDVGTVDVLSDAFAAQPDNLDVVTALMQTFESFNWRHPNAETRRRRALRARLIVEYPTVDRYAGRLADLMYQQVRIEANRRLGTDDDPRADVVAGFGYAIMRRHLDPTQGEAIDLDFVGALRQITP